MNIVTIPNVSNLDDIANCCDPNDYEPIQVFRGLGDDAILTTSSPVYFTELGLLAIEGTYLSCVNSEEGNLEPDWDLTLIYRWSPDTTEFTESNAQDYIYFEQDPMETALHNYLRSISDENR